MHTKNPRFNEWLAAEREASDAERMLHREMLRAAAGEGAPDKDLVLTARAMRAKAQFLFDEAMQEMKTLAQSLQHGRSDARPGSSRAEPDQQH